MTDQPAAKPQKKTLLQTLAFFGERRSLAMLGLGFASGLPFMLIFDTLSLWLRDSGVSLAVIGFFSLATLSFSFKFLWAPLIDRARVPVLHKLMGHRRAWILVFQIAMILGLWTISTLNPASQLGILAAVAVAVGFATASHDVVLDAWRIEVADKEEQGPMAVAYQWGYRGAMIAAGAGPLLLAERFGWNFSYAVMGFVVGIGVMATLWAPREAEHTVRPIPTGDVNQSRPLEILEWIVRLGILLVGALALGSGLSGDASLLSKLVGGEALAEAWKAKPNGVWLQLLGVLTGLAIVLVAAWPIPKVRTKPGVYMSAAFGDPLIDFTRRFHGVAGLILAAICVYRVSDFVLNIMNPFYRDMGFTLTEIAEIRKVFGIIASMIGVFLGGVIVARLGLMKALVIGAFAQPISNLFFAWLAMSGHNVPVLFWAICIDNVAGGVAGTALIAYMSSLTTVGFTATQYALFSSLYALPGKLIASQSGRIVEASAIAAEAGGPIGALKGLFTRLPPESFTAAGAKLGVSAPAMAAGYTAFFLYTALIGVAAIVLSFMVAARQGEIDRRAEAEEAAAKPA
ncbi:MAG: permease [Caulobacter sp. 32-67-35]|nr:MAG: permease [Caulobacter sp. 32-67-35]OZA76757.1 MAG: permease [Caulobacter sp. 39-67-4]HQR88340.1 MFS transporter [Caulobacter sp.]